MLAIGTRFFGSDAENDLLRLSKFIETGQLLGNIFVAVNFAVDGCCTLAYCAERYPRADVFEVRPWQKFVAPLNAIIYRAMLTGADRLLLASAEFAPGPDEVDILNGHVHDDTLVAGARFSEHEFSKGEVVGNGLTVPWNTFALWNLKLLGRIGFPLVGDAAFDQRQAGVEEVSAIALYQKLLGVKKAQAKLVSIPGFREEWNMAGWDDDRRAKHEAKIKSKASRPAVHLEWAEFNAPIVLHIADASRSRRISTPSDPRYAPAGAITESTHGVQGAFCASR